MRCPRRGKKTKTHRRPATFGTAAQPHSRTAARACMPNFVYLLQSTSSPAKTYIGVTNDIARRLRQHNGEIVGGARYTRRFRPWKFLALFAMRSRREALQLEWRAKHTSRRVGERGPPPPPPGDRLASTTMLRASSARRARARRWWRPAMRAYASR